MLDQFQEIELKFNDLERKMSDPEVISDQSKYQSILKKHAELQLGVDLYRKLKRIFLDIEDLNSMKDDPDMKDSIKE